MNSIAPTASTGVFKKAGIRETAVLLALAWFVPFAIHLVPWTGDRPLGAYLLPMFWAAFVAVYFYGAAVGLLVGLFAPGINLLLTGMPAGKFIAEISFELVVLVVIAALLLRRFPRLVLIAPLGYLAGRSAWAGVQAILGGAGNAGGQGAILAQSLIMGLAGMIVLAAINAGLVWFYPKK